jgi:mono/diheme cytochrome c family protein
VSASYGTTRFAQKKARRTVAHRFVNLMPEKEQRLRTTVTRTLLWIVFAAIAGTLVGGSIYGIRLVRYGFSARSRPSLLEAAVARRARMWAIPAEARELKNPVPATEEMLTHGRNHWADHCATCHANNGSGDTEIGRNLYPKAPDMRSAATQSLSDGELYYIIRNGVRMTGMPAWGNPEDRDSDHETWMLVAFIRHLPQVTAEEASEMRKFNPKSMAEREEEQMEEDFLNGKTPKEKAHDH